MSWIRRIGHLALAAPRRVVDALFGYDFFLSYAHADGRDYAEALDKALREKYTVHLDARDYKVGQDLRSLTRLRVRNSRILVVVGRHHALTQSYWVRREVEIFHETGRDPVIVNVDGALEAALAAAHKEDSLAAWFAGHRERRADGTPVDPLLIEVDTAEPSAGPRLPQPHVVQRLQDRFSGDRVETRRLRIVTAALVVLILATGAALWQTLVAEEQREAAVLSLAQATSNELAARARVVSPERPDLGLVLAARAIGVARSSAVSWTAGASALRDIMTQTQGARGYCLQRGEGRALDYSAPAGLLAVATEAGAVCLFRRDEGAGLRLVDTLQSFAGGAVETLHFSADGEWLVTQMRGGPLRALPVGAIYEDIGAIEPGGANYRFRHFGETDMAKAVSFDGDRSRIAFYSQATKKLEIWGLLEQGPTTTPLVTLVPNGHVLATAFDPSGSHLVALVHETNEFDEAEGYQFWLPSTFDLKDPLRFRIKIWSLATLALEKDFAVLEKHEGVYLGDGIVMGALRGALSVGPDATFVAPAMFLADSHSLEPQMIAQVIRTSDLSVVADFVPQTAGTPFDGWEQISAIGFANDGGAFYALDDSVIRFWSLPAAGESSIGPKRLRELTTPGALAGARRAQGVVSAVSMAPDGNLVATLDSTDSLAVWDVSGQTPGADDEPLLFVEGIGTASSGTPTALAFSDDGKVLFFATEGGEVRVCDVGSRCGPVAPQHASQPLTGGQWKQLFAPDHDKWIAAVSEQQTVSFFRSNDLSAPFFQASASDNPAPVVQRGFAVLSGTPGRAVIVISSADGTWAAIFERDQYGFNEKLRLVRLTDQPEVIDVTLASGDCDGRFLTVQFDPFAPQIVALSKFGCIAFAKLPDRGAGPIVADHPLPAFSSGLDVPLLTFTKNLILLGAEDRGQLWHRNAKTGLPDKQLLDHTDGPLFLPADAEHVIAARYDGMDTAPALASYPLAPAGDIGAPAAIGDYASVNRVAVGETVVVVVGTRSGASSGTVAVWPLSDLSRPLLEHAQDFGAFDPQITFSPSSTRILVGPQNYALKDDRPDPRNSTAILLDLTSATPAYRVLDIDLGVQTEGCTISGNDNSCYDINYAFSPDGTWVDISRDQSFGPPGPATVWSLEGLPAPRLAFPEGSIVEFDPTSRWLMSATDTQQRLWWLDEKSRTWTDQGRLASGGWSWFLPHGSGALTLTSGEIALQSLAVDDLIAQLPDFVGRNLSPREWADLFPLLDYEESFPTLPPNLERISDLVNQAEVLAGSGNREEASAQFALAAQLAVRTGSIETCKTVVTSAQKAGLPSSASAALEYAARILPKDREVQELVRVSNQPGAAAVEPAGDG